MFTNLVFLCGRFRWPWDFIFQRVDAVGMRQRRLQGLPWHAHVHVLTPQYVNQFHVLLGISGRMCLADSKWILNAIGFFYLIIYTYMYTLFGKQWKCYSAISVKLINDKIEKLHCILNNNVFYYNNGIYLIIYIYVYMLLYCILHMCILHIHTCMYI